MHPKILLVDDNVDLLMITQIILKGQGCETVIALSLEEAERKIKIHQPSLILLDICVGDEDGRIFCQNLKLDPDTNNIKIILMSGDDCMDHDQCNADDFLSKPFDYNELVEKVQIHLMHARESSELVMKEK
jgi:two-component system phosphate regulon response regulator PhoB